MEDKVKPQSEKIKAILNRLENKKGTEKTLPKDLNINQVSQEVKNKQTVSDDFKVTGSKEKTITHYEDIIRKALSLFDISYDELIRMDGKSAYCQAIGFYPHLLDEVKKSECPPLIALQIAKSMQPYIEFTQKYGSTLDEIKQNLKEEIKKENEQSVKELNKDKAECSQEPTKVKQASIFADIDSAITENSNKKQNPSKEEGLDFLFAN